MAVGRSGCAAERDVAALDHEARHEPVKGGVIVCAACAEGEEVLFGRVSDLYFFFFLANGLPLRFQGRFRKRFQPLNRRAWCVAVSTVSRKRKYFISRRRKLTVTDIFVKIRVGKRVVAVGEELCGQNNHQSQRRCLRMQQPHPLYNTTTITQQPSKHNRTIIQQSIAQAMFHYA